MTQMGLEYLKYVEGNRTNVANEGIKDRTLDESRRHNVTFEAETNRSNISNEAISRGRAAEDVRSNKTNEGISAYRAKEENRSNVAREGIQLGNLRESVRTNVANEGIKQGQLNEMGRSNLRNEGISQQRADTDVKYQVEIGRSNLVKEGQARNELGETILSNRNRERDSRTATNLNYLSTVPAQQIAANRLQGDGLIATGIGGEAWKGLSNDYSGIDWILGSTQNLGKLRGMTVK